MTARDHFKRLLADAFEQICILQEQLELAQAEISRLSAEQNGHKEMAPEPVKEQG